MEEYARVSDILKAYTDFSMIDPVTLARKAQIGTHVHEYIACEFSDIFYEITPEEEGYVESYHKWKDKNKGNLEILAVEQRYYEEYYKITGCVDMQANFEGKGVIIDFKTSATANIPVWHLQGSLYTWILSESTEKLPKKCIFVNLQKSGKMPKVIEFDMSKETLLLAVSAVTVYRHFHPLQKCHS